MRPSWEDIFLEFAMSIADRSTCSRLRVGAVATSWDHTRVLAMGYNGSFRGGPNACDDPDREGACGCLHAEVNMVAKLDYNDPVRKRVYLTHSPCAQCAKLMVNAGIDWVGFEVPYRSRGGIDILRRAGVDVACVGHADVTVSDPYWELIAFDRDDIDVNEILERADRGERR